MGYYPNHIQGAEIYHDRAIAYSLGDFVFDQSPLQDHDTAALRVSLRNQQMKVEFLPITIRDSKLQMATGDRGAAILKTIRDASKSFEQPMRFPAVLKAKPNFKLPESLKAPPNDADYPSTPNPSQPPDQQTSTPDSTMESEPAPYPIMRESEALFSPKPASPDSETNSNLTENTPKIAPELDRWGEKPAASEREFEPIPAGALPRQQQPEVPESEIPDFESPDPDRLERSESTQSESIQPQFPRTELTQTELTQAESSEPSEYEAPPAPSDQSAAAESESVAPFVDPFLDSYYDSPQQNTADESTDFDHANEANDQPVEPPSVNSIEPYAEPLVGPISALPADAIAPIETAEVTPSALAQIEAPIAASPETEYSPPKPKVFDD